MASVLERRPRDARNRHQHLELILVEPGSGVRGVEIDHPDRTLAEQNRHAGERPRPGAGQALRLGQLAVLGHLVAQKSGLVFHHVVYDRATDPKGLGGRARFLPDGGKGLESLLATQEDRRSLGG